MQRIREVVAKIATTAKDGKTYQVIIIICYFIKSKQCIRKINIFEIKFILR